jgi:hypothetical protein
MNARTSWSARADHESGENRRKQASNDMSMPLDEILESRFSDDGRLDQSGRLQRQRMAGRHDPRAPILGSEDLERAVQKLALGLESIERQSGSGTMPDPAGSDAMSAEAERRDPRSRDTVTHSLDRLEARLEQLSRKLQQRNSGAVASAVGSVAQIASTGTAPTRPAPASPAPLPAEHFVSEPVGHMAEEPSRAYEPVARLTRETPEERLRQFSALEARIEALQQNLDANQIEPVRHELLDLLRQVEEIGRSGRSVAGVVEQVRAKLDDMEVRINATRNLAGNRLGELQDRLAFLAERLGDMEGEVPGFDALRENQSAILERFDRMEGLVHRLSPPEEILDRVEGLRRQLQTLPSQREIVRIEEHLVELAGRLETLPADLSHAPLLERIDGQLRSIAAELAETRKHGESGVSDVRQRLVELHDGLQEVAESGRTPDLTGLDEKLSDIASRLEVDRRFSGETLAGLDKRLAALTAAVENQEGAAAAELLAGLNSKIDVLSEAMDANGPRGSRRELEGLDRKLDELQRLLAERTEQLSKPQLEPLQERLDEMHARLEDLATGVRASSAELGPFAQTLQDISDRVTASGERSDDNVVVERLAAIEERLAGLSTRGSDPRAIHNQLENIVSRLELLKGRSIDPARLSDIFDRVDAAMRTGLADERFERLERLLDERTPPRVQGVAGAAGAAYRRDRPGRRPRGSAGGGA